MHESHDPDKYCVGTHIPYSWGRFNEFHRMFKRELYGWHYGNYECLLIHNDFYSMYDMGGEL